MKLFNVLPKGKNLKGACKRQILQQSLGVQACNCIKKRLQHRTFSVNIPKFLGTAFFIEQLRWLLFNYVLVSERILKKESLWGDCLRFN